MITFPTTDEVREFISTKRTSIYKSYVKLPNTRAVRRSIEAELRTMLLDALMLGADPALEGIDFTASEGSSPNDVTVIVYALTDDARGAWRALFPQEKVH